MNQVGTMQEQKTVRLTDLKKAVDFLRAVNDIEFRNIRWEDDLGKEVIPEDSGRLQMMGDWEYIGLSNVDYGKILLSELNEKTAAQVGQPSIAESDEE